MPRQPPSDRALRARHALLEGDGGARLPLGRHGEALRRRVREAPAEDRLALLAAWRDALDALHRAGWGTDDPVEAALVTERSRVRLLPDRCWPLGTLVARRPVSRWLDRSDALAWLRATGAAGDLLRTLEGHAPPWPGWPELPPGAPLALVGPPLEGAALAEHAGIAWLAAARLATAAGRAWALAALRLGTPWILPLGEGGWLARLEAVPARVVRLPAAGSPVTMTPEQIEALGMAPSLLAPPPGPSAAAGEPEAARRALESAALEGDPAARARVEAEALLTAWGADDPGALRDGAPLDALVDAARASGSRPLTLRAITARGLARLAWPGAAHHGSAATDLVEARRLASALGRPADAVRADAARVLEATIGGHDPRGEPDPRPVEDEAARAWRDAATLAAGAAVDEGAGLLAAGPRLLGAAVTTGEAALVGAVVELVGGLAVAWGREAAAERALGAALAVGHPPAVRPLIIAWLALLAARRGAGLTARDRLLELSAGLPAASGAGGPRAGGWWPRAGGRAALAARALELEGLMQPFASLGPTSRASRLALDPGAALDHAAQWPTWLLLMAGEAALSLSESRARQARLLVRARLERLDADRWPPGACLAMARLEAACFAVDDARRAFELAAVAGERHVERAALEGLAALGPRGGVSAEIGAAIGRRLDQLRAREAPALDAVPLPLSPQSAAAHQAALVRRAAEALEGGGWRAAVEALCGPLEAPPPSPDEATLGLTLHLVDGAWVVEGRGGTAAPLTTPPGDSPEALALALLALAPAAVAVEATARPRSEGSDEEPPWPERTDAALCAGEVTFDDAVIGPFRAHDLTRAALRALLHLGLTATSGLYRALAARWRLPEGDYQRFMDFLRRAQVALDYRPYRRGEPDARQEPVADG